MDIVSSVSAVAGLLEILARSLSKIYELQQKFKEVDVTLTLLKTELDSIEVALACLQRAIDRASHHVQHYELAIRLNTSLDGCRILLLFVDGKLGNLLDSRAGRVAFKRKMRILLQDAETRNHLEQMSRIITALGVVCQSLQQDDMSEQLAILNEQENRKVLDQVRDDSTSLRVLLDNSSCFSRRTEISANSSKLSIRLAVDRELLSHRVYQQTFRSLMRRARTLYNGPQTDASHGNTYAASIVSTAAAISPSELGYLPSDIETITQLDVPGPDLTLLVQRDITISVDETQLPNASLMQPLNDTSSLQSLLQSSQYLESTVFNLVVGGNSAITASVMRQLALDQPELIDSHSYDYWYHLVFRQCGIYVAHDNHSVFDRSDPDEDSALLIVIDRCLLSSNDGARDQSFVGAIQFLLRLLRDRDPDALHLESGSLGPVVVSPTVLARYYLNKFDMICRPDYTPSVVDVALVRNAQESLSHIGSSLSMALASEYNLASIIAGAGSERLHLFQHIPTLTRDIKTRVTSSFRLVWKPGGGELSASDLSDTTASFFCIDADDLYKNNDGVFLSNEEEATLRSFDLFLQNLKSRSTIKVLYVTSGTFPSALAHAWMDRFHYKLEDHCLRGCSLQKRFISMTSVSLEFSNMSSPLLTSKPLPSVPYVMDSHQIGMVY